MSVSNNISSAVWTALNLIADLPGMGNDIRVLYAKKLWKTTKLNPVYESTSIDMMHALGDVCWNELMLVASVISIGCEVALGEARCAEEDVDHAAWEEYWAIESELAELYQKLEEQMIQWDDWKGVIE